MDELIPTARTSGWWGRYKCFVESATCFIPSERSPEIIYWRDSLFSNFIIYLFPVCLIALLPGVFMGVKTGNLFIAGFDLLTVSLIAVVVFNKKLPLYFRKIFVVFMLYCLSVALVLILGLMGPGLIYLLMLNVLVAFLFRSAIAYWSVASNVVICVGFALIIGFKLSDTPLVLQYTVGTWIAVSSNLIFLSFVSVTLISFTLNRFEEIIDKELVLKNELATVNFEIARRNKVINESEIHYRSLFYRNPSPMWVLDNETLMFLQVNESAIHEYGYTNEEFLTLSIGDIKTEKDMETIHETLNKPLNSGAPASIITQHRRKNKEQFYAEVRFNSFLLNGKESTLSIITDMTKQINFTKAIETQNSKLKEIAWIQSHLVRAPLVRIMGLVDMIITNKDQVPDIDALEFLDQSAKEFDEIIKTITSKTEQIVVVA